MTALPSSADAVEASALGALLHLGRRSRHAQSASELGFIAVNETWGLTHYRQAALWLSDRGVPALSGVVSPDANSSYVHWLTNVGKSLAALGLTQPTLIAAEMLGAQEVAEWGDWLPPQALWLPLPELAEGVQGGLLLARDEEWHGAELALLAEWGDTWSFAWQRLQRPTLRSRWQSVELVLRAWLPSRLVLRRCLRPRGRKLYWGRIRQTCRQTPWREWRKPSWWRDALLAIWRSPPKRYAVIVLGILLFPVHLTVLAPGELAPANPVVVRAPIDGVVDKFFIAPNAQVTAGDLLFQLDLTTLTSKLAVAEQALATSEAEYRQAAQVAVFDTKGKAQLAALQGRIAEKQAEAEYLKAQFARAQVVAPRDGIAIVDDPSEWIGKPVVTGERIMSVSEPRDVEVEAWLAVTDAIDLPENARVTLYLSAMPLSPVEATLRYAAHEAVQRPDGSFAYRVRARLPAGSAHPRVGLKGTAKITGHYVPCAYWIMRRPLAVIRQAMGF